MAPLVVAIRLQPPLVAVCAGLAQVACPLVWLARFVWTWLLALLALLLLLALENGTLLLWGWL
jgi:hypothetical protein